MAHIPVRQFTIAVEYVPIKGSEGQRGEYVIRAWDQRLPQSWNRKWRLLTEERPEFEKRTDELRWAIDALHDRLHGPAGPRAAGRGRIDLELVQRRAEGEAWQFA